LIWTAACRGWAESQAAYRFFDNDRVTCATILHPHQDATLERILDGKEFVFIGEHTTYTARVDDPS